MSAARRVTAASGAVVAAAAALEALLVHLGRTFGSSAEERAMALPGDHIVA